MPSSMTHTYFGLEVYNLLPKTCQTKISSNLEHFKLFCQGSDPFMFYNFLIGKKANQMKNIQKRIHKENTQQYFLNIIKYIHTNNLQTNPEIMAFLYGNICHYYLDLHTHPFLYYKSGIFNKKNNQTYKYNGLHQQIEYAIDIYLIQQNENISPKNFKIHKEIFKLKKFSPQLKELINNILKNTYSIKNGTSKYLKSIKFMKSFFYIANYDPIGIKLNIYKIIDKITSKKTIKLKELSFYNNYPSINNYLNIEHNNWNYPWDKTKKFNTSFFDLYKEAKNETLKTIKEVTTILEQKELNINKIKIIFPNLSYVTGKICSEKNEMKYFEF